MANLNTINVGQKVKKTEKGETIFGEIKRITKATNEFAVQWDNDPNKTYSVYRQSALGKTVTLA